MSLEKRKSTQMTESIAENVGIRFCTNCNLTRSAFGGRDVFGGGGRRRWKCSSCIAKSTSVGFKAA
jgi:hypothetical protein